MGSILLLTERAVSDEKFGELCKLSNQNRITEKKG